MGKSDAALNYKSMSPDDRRSFDRWLKANAIFGLIFAAGVVAMAFAGSMSGSRDARRRRLTLLRLLRPARSRQTGIRRAISPPSSAELIVEDAAPPAVARPYPGGWPLRS